jgi:glycosyltransferase involved in cell wall biosynthesis
MSEDNSVSVVVPCFNAASTVADTIESAVAQTWRNLEIIVVDDGSTDNSTTILSSFEDQITIVSGPNRGASSARNRGTALATGAYIQYLDADDLLAPDAIERRLSALCETGADVAYSDWQRFETTASGVRQLGEIIARKMEDVDQEPELACATAFWAPPVALLYRRHVVDAIGGWNERLPVIQDARFLFDAARRKSCFVHVPGVSAFYRQASTSLSRGNEGRFMLDVYRNATEIQSMWEADALLTEARKTALAGVFDMTARTFLQLGMPEFVDAVARLRSLSGRKFGYSQVAQIITRFAGRDVAIAAVDVSALLVRSVRSLLDNKR